jgi:hypothetical protein
VGRAADWEQHDDQHDDDRRDDMISAALRAAISRAILRCEWIHRLPLPDDAPDDGYLLCESERIRAREIRDARAALAALTEMLHTEA